jgi:hypothetical protein
MDDTANNTELKEQLLADGHEAFDASDFMRALDFYHRAALLDANDIAVWTALGLTFSNLDFPREAWRSYLLALNIEPSNANALWYAAEFLYEVEDLSLADLFLGNYLMVEEDPEKQQEGRQLRDEIRAEGKARGISFDDTRSADAQHMLDNPDQPTLDDEPELAGNATASEDWSMSEDELEEAALSDGRFTPPLSLRLLGSEGFCQHCKLQIPLDAPYCWSCKMIHFYE